MVIILVVILVVGFVGKFAIDRIFSMIFLSQIVDTEFDLKSILPDSRGFITEATDEYAIRDKLDTDTQRGKNEEESKEGETIEQNYIEKAVEKNVANSKGLSKTGQDIDRYEKKEQNNDIIDKVEGTNIVEDNKKDIERNIEENDGIQGNDGMQGNEEREGRDEIIDESKKTGSKDIEEAIAEDRIESISEDSKDTVMNGKENKSIENTGNNKEDNDNGIIKVTDEKIVRAEKEISTSDKLKALDIILRKLKFSDIEKLIAVLKKGNLSKDDINSAKNIIKEQVTEEEKNVLKDLFNKYEYLVE